MSRYIDQAKAIEVVENIQLHKNVIEVVRDIIAELEDIESADVRENVRGEWLQNEESPWLYECSKCHRVFLGTTDFCPNCGADMRDT